MYWVPKGKAGFTCCHEWLVLLLFLFSSRWHIASYIPEPQKIHLVFGKEIAVPEEVIK